MAEYRMSRDPSNRKIFIGDLPRDVRKDDLEEACRKYGRVLDVWLARNPPGFAFVEYEDDRDAADAVHALDGQKLCGGRVRAEISANRSRRGRGPKSDSKCYECNQTGHFARECRRRGNNPRSRRDRSMSPSHRRGRSDSPPRRSRRSVSRRREASPAARRHSNDRSPSPRRGRSSSKRPRYSRSRSASGGRSHPRNGRSASPKRKRSNSPYSPKKRDDDRAGGYAASGDYH